MGYNWAKQDMTHKIKIVSLLMISAMLFFVGCKKNNSENETNEINEIPEETFDDVIPEEIIQLLDNCPITNYQDPSIFGFNGKSTKPLDNLFAAMSIKAMELTRGDIIYGAGVQNQHGLAYVSGLGNPRREDKAYWIARKPTWREGIECGCKEELYGTDCSGFIAHVMSSVGIKPLEELAQKTAHQQVQYFKNDLKELNTSFYKGKVSVQEFEKVDIASIENGNIIYKIKNGDIIYKLDGDEACHIGIFFKTTNSNSLIMFQSSGSYRYACSVNRHEGGHGPIQREIHPDTLNKYFDVAGGNARVLRIIDSNWVDLGLPSGKLWATRNIGANSPEDYGYYVEWNNLASAEAEWAEKVGFDCHTPTLVEWQELIDTNNTTSTWITQNSTFPWTTQNGVNGRLFTSKKNGETLFLPAAGFLHEGNIYNTGQYADLGFYWTSTPSENNPNNVWYIRFNSIPDEKPVWNDYLRLFGLSVRAVRSPN